MLYSSHFHQTELECFSTISSKWKVGDFLIWRILLHCLFNFHNEISFSFLVISGKIHSRVAIRDGREWSEEISKELLCKIQASASVVKFDIDVTWEISASIFHGFSLVFKSPAPGADNLGLHTLLLSELNDKFTLREGY